MGTLTILLHLYFPRRSHNSTSHLNMDPRNARCISIFHAWELFQPHLKSKLLQLFSVATLLLKHVLFAAFTTRPLLPATKKIVLPSHHHNNVIYVSIVCHCDSRYAGRTSQRFQESIKQHVPRLIKNSHSSKDRSNLSHACRKNSTSQVTAHDSAIGQHLLENPPCGS